MSNLPNCPVTVDEIREYFCQAMARGWASGAKAKRERDLPNHERIEDVSGPFWMVDRYCTNNYGQWSSGTTTIFYYTRENGWQPIWVMNYGGFYSEEVIKFLKWALMENYSKGIFLGGRGPASFSLPGQPYYYVNLPQGAGMGSRSIPPRGDNLEVFWGVERVCLLESNEEKGFHQYSGMSLLPKSC